MGHEYMRDYVERRYDASYVVVADYGERTQTDPLLYDERARILGRTHPEANVFPGHDTGEKRSSMDSITAVAPDEFTAVTGSDWTRDLFETFDYSVDVLDDWQYDFHASDVRARIREGEAWRHMVSDPVVDVLDELAFERLVESTTAPEIDS
jgi:nicotinamide mononucleotide adenylyltransferase